MPRSLRRQETLEVNGCVSRDGKPVVKGDTSKSSFALKLVGRFPHDHDGAGGSTLKTLTAVRFFFPEFQGYLQASSNPDKGETLDALPGVSCSPGPKPVNAATTSCVPRTSSSKRVALLDQPPARSRSSHSPPTSAAVCIKTCLFR